jgi:hypothetical protein
MANGDTRPRHFFLNEEHELATLTDAGGGQNPNFAPIDWQQKSLVLRRSFDIAAAYAVRVRDPSAKAHRFLLAAPASLTKHSTSKQAQSTGGKVSFVPSFGGKQANVLTKLSMDLLSVDAGGNATVHVPASKVPQLQAKLDDLANASTREKFRWVNIGEFQSVDWSRRVDTSWLETIRADEVEEVHLRFQPVLPRSEIQAVLEAIRAELKEAEQLHRTGRDFSGRYWCIGKMKRATIRRLAEQYPSLQSLHPRLSTPIAGAAVRRGLLARPIRSPIVDLTTLPTIGLFDTGIPEDHRVLRPYIRNRYKDPDMGAELQVRGDHGSQVGSVLVFGRAAFHGQPDPNEMPPPTCRIFDMLGGWTRRHAEVPDELWDRAIDGVIATADDIRVFNISLGGQRAQTLRAIELQEKLRYLQDLDNHAFARDVLLVFAAGNSREGVAPGVRYPRHLDEDAWQLGVLAWNFNGLVVGAHVEPLAPRGIVREVGAPSPFSLVGPGQLSTPVPTFSASGGDATDDYHFAPSSGVWAFDANGALKDCVGTSYAVPLVAREAAFAFRDLAQYCPDARPFAATIRAWLTLVARRPEFRGGLEKLAKRTLGKGFPSSDRIRTADPQRAVFIWQTILESAGSIARVAVPVPQQWLQRAAAPKLRLVLSWLTPVNAALTETWACRKIGAQLRVGDDPGLPALRTGPGAVGAYPVSDRTFEIAWQQLQDAQQVPSNDLWSLSVSYEDLGPAPAGMEFTAQQRVGVAIELWDDSDAAVSPQAMVQALNIPAMNRLSVLQAPIQVPIVVR